MTYHRERHWGKVRVSFGSKVTLKTGPFECSSMTRGEWDAFFAGVSYVCVYLPHSPPSALILPIISVSPTLREDRQEVLFRVQRELSSPGQCHIRRATQRWQGRGKDEQAVIQRNLKELFYYLFLLPRGHFSIWWKDDHPQSRGNWYASGPDFGIVGMRKVSCSCSLD